MADQVTFKQAYFRDSALPQSLEDAIRLTCAYSGCHDFDFQDVIDEDFSSAAEWVVTSGGSMIVSDDKLELQGGGDAKMYLATHSEQVPLGMVATFDWVEGDGGGFFFLKSDDDSRCFALGFNQTNVSAFRCDDDGSPHNITVVPHNGSITPPCRIQVEAAYSLDTVDEDRKWVQGQMFVDGQAKLGFALDVGETIHDWDGEGVGFLVYGSGICTVDNLTVSALHRLVEWTTIDVGQPPATGMSRAIGTTRVKYMCRHDNTVRVWRPGNRDADWTSTEGRVVKLEGMRDIGTPNHVRVQAAIYEADGFDDGANEDYMHRFILHNDPNIMTEKESYLEAFRVLHDHREKEEIRRFAIPPNYLLEPNDRITVSGEDWRVTSVNLSIQNTDQGPQIVSMVEAQKYEELTLP